MNRRRFAMSMAVSICGLSGCAFNGKDTSELNNTSNDNETKNKTDDIVATTTATDSRSGTGQLILYKSGKPPGNTTVHDAKNENFLDIDKIEEILIKGDQMTDSNRDYPEGDLLSSIWINNRTKGKQIEEKLGYINDTYVEYKNNTYILVYQIVEE